MLAENYESKSSKLVCGQGFRSLDLRFKIALVILIFSNISKKYSPHKQKRQESHIKHKNNIENVETIIIL